MIEIIGWIVAAFAWFLAAASLMIVIGLMPDAIHAVTRWREKRAEERFIREAKKK